MSAPPLEGDSAPPPTQEQPSILTVMAVMTLFKVAPYLLQLAIELCEEVFAMLRGLPPRRGEQQPRQGQQPTRGSGTGTPLAQEKKTS